MGCLKRGFGSETRLTCERVSSCFSACNARERRVDCPVADDAESARICANQFDPFADTFIVAFCLTPCVPPAVSRYEVRMGRMVQVAGGVTGSSKMNRAPSDDGSAHILPW